MRSKEYNRGGAKEEEERNYELICWNVQLHSGAQPTTDWGEGMGGGGEIVSNLRFRIILKRRRSGHPFLVYILRHQFYTYCENLKVIEWEILSEVIFCGFATCRF